MIGSLVSRLVILTFGALYPAYSSFKVVQAKDESNYVRWMIYFIVFAIFTSIEIFTDLFLRWFPFYYEMKVLFVLWLVSPMFNGSSILYRQFLHPLLKSKEPEIDRIKEEGYATLRQVSKKVIFRARDIVVDVAHQLHSNLLHSITSSDDSHSVEGNKEAASVSKNVPHEEGCDKGSKNLIKNRGCRCRAIGWKIMD